MFLYSSSEKFEESKVFIELTLLKLLFLHKSSYSSSDKLSSTNNSLFLYFSFNSFIVFSNSLSSISSFSLKVNSLFSILYPELVKIYFPKETIDNIPDYVNIGEECKEFFENNQNFKLNTLISVFEYIELWNLWNNKKYW